MGRLCRTTLMVGLACFFAALGLRADTVSMTLTNPPPGNTLGDIYVDPYTATVGGVSTTVICDDWSDNTYTGETWTANVINEATVGNTTLGTPKFGNNQALYNELTWLADQMEPATPQNATLDTELSFAVWDLTYGANGTNEETPSPLTYLAENLTGGTTNSEYLATVTLISDALGEGSYTSAYTWEILTPESGTASCGGSNCASSPPQEFLMRTAAEPSSLTLLAVELLLMAGFAGLMHWRKARA